MRFLTIEVPLYHAKQQSTQGWDARGIHPGLACAQEIEENEPDWCDGERSGTEREAGEREREVETFRTERGGREAYRPIRRADAPPNPARIPRRLRSGPLPAAPPESGVKHLISCSVKPLTWVASHV